MRALVLEPGYCPYVSIFRNGEDAVQQIFVGPHEVTLPFENNVIALVSSREQVGLPHNRVIGEGVSVNGRALICGWDGKHIKGLTKEQADRYYRRYLYPEKIEDTPAGPMILPCMTPRVKPVDERFGKKPNWLER